MRYVIAREDKECAVCGEVIPKGDICIQKADREERDLFYHCEYSESGKQDCHGERFGTSIWHRARMTETVKVKLEAR